MHMMIFFGTLTFAIACSLVKLLRAFVLHDNEVHQTISDGLTGPYHWIEVVGFIAFGASLVLLGIELASPVSWLCWMVAVGILGAMASDTFRPFLIKHLGGDFAKWHQRHIYFAAIAFIGAAFLMAALAHGPLLWALVAAYPLSVGIIRWIWPNYTAWQEWMGTLAILAFLCVWGIG